jgi:hypothetical protein
VRKSIALVLVWLLAASGSAIAGQPQEAPICSVGKLARDAPSPGVIARAVARDSARAGFTAGSVTLGLRVAQQRKERSWMGRHSFWTGAMIGAATGAVVFRAACRPTEDPRFSTCPPLSASFAPVYGAGVGALVGGTVGMIVGLITR